MANPHDVTRVDDADHPPPLGQRLFDNMFLLLTVGVVIMIVVYTGWGLWEIIVMPSGTLP
jgi:hypothetical protein